MLKYAFLINVSDVTPRTYSAVYKNDLCYSMVVGVDGQEAGRKYVELLLRKGFHLINLCSDFNDETLEVLQRMAEKMAAEGTAEKNVKIRRAEYSFDEVLKINITRSFRNFGLIIVAPGIDKPHEKVLRSAERDTRVIFVRNIRQARNAGRRLVEKRTHFAELSSWFDRMRMEEVIDAMENAIPVGTCGDLHMRELENYEEPIIRKKLVLPRK